MCLPPTDSCEILKPSLFTQVSDWIRPSFHESTAQLSWRGDLLQSKPHKGLMMPSNLLLWGGAVVLCSMASPILSFSHGASRTSCQEMIPGHIRAHPLDLKHSFITIPTSAASYLPGQLITVTVRSSRDFMGFLLQARSVGGERNGFVGGPEIRTERLGPLLVGGSWIRTPPGTHTLRCLFEGDTVTHSDKQLKRNLSFVWRAPDMPKGDIRFHISVVQSYFIYWTGIESAVVRDRSPRAWRGSKPKMVDGASTAFTVQATVTAQTALKANKAPKKQTKGRATPDPFLRNPSNIKSATEILKFLKIQTQDDDTTLEANSSVTWTNHTVTVKKALTLGSLPSNTQATPGSLADVSNEVTTDPFSYTTTTSTCTLTSTLTDSGNMVTTTNFPSATFSPLDPLGPLFPQKEKQTKSNDLQVNSQEQKLNHNPGRKHYMTLTRNTTQGLSIRTFYSPFTPGPAYHNLKDPSKTKSTKFETLSFSEKLGDNFPTKSQMSIIKTEETPSYQVSSLSSKDLRSKTDTSQTSIGPKSTPKQTSSPQTTMPNINQSLPVTKPTQAQQRQKLRSYTLRLSSQILSQTRRVFSQYFVTPQPVPVSTGERDLKSRENTKTMTPIFDFVRSNTPSSFSASNHLDVSSSADSLSSSLVIHLSENINLHVSGRSVTSTSSIHSPSPSSNNRAKTTPAHSVPPVPSPISMPHLSSAQRYYTTTQSTFPTSSTIFSFSPSNDPSTSSLPTSTFPPSTTSSRFLSTSTSTRSPAFSSLISSNSFFYSSTHTFSPPSFAPTSPSTSPPLIATSSSFISPISSPYPEPTSARHHFINTPFPSSVPNKITVDERPITQTDYSTSKTHFTSPAHRKVVHQNPKPYPNLRPNHGQEIKPNIHNMDTKPKRPSDPSETPDKEGKFPDVIPRHSAWELGMLLGCSAGLGMVLVAGVRYVYRQACGRRTEVTLNDREREYGRGEPGLIQLQECGDLVRVRKIRENSLVLLAEYDILAPPTN
ncbi:hypothetical protein AMECASPLE_027428 [Ameca splendens]|uniref:Reelin domain-containing protein n=1 Tax=Ameca splendens TaxID=208324 RepID=A0ABV0ZE27_9TELE